MNPNTPMNTLTVPSPAVGRLNALVEEFDTLTGGRLDTCHDPLAMMGVALLWPGARPGLGQELYAAAEAVKREGGAR